MPESSHLLLVKLKQGSSAEADANASAECVRSKLNLKVPLIDWIPAQGCETTQTMCLLEGRLNVAYQQLLAHCRHGCMHDKMWFEMGTCMHEPKVSI